MRKLLIVVDMQNDFIDGALANEDAQKIVTPIAEVIKNWSGEIIFTLDTHRKNYLDTLEGKYLPIPHCIIGEMGHGVNRDIVNSALDNNKCNWVYCNKQNFGYLNWISFIKNHFKDCFYDEIYMCGTCTDICVVSNALILKATFPETPIKVYGNLCAGTTKEKHEVALEVMRSCQCEVIDYDIC